jgi:hypothetical protein
MDKYEKKWRIVMSENYQKTIRELNATIEELQYRLSHCVELLKTAKCPSGCNGKCTWCYEREIEVRAH